jgi:hypothetical protein
MNSFYHENSSIHLIRQTVSNVGIGCFSTSRQRNRLRNCVKQQLRIENNNACRKRPVGIHGRDLGIAHGKSCCADPRTLISIKAFFLAVYQACSLTFASVFRHSVSDPFLYLSCRPCLPLRASFSRCPSSSRHEGAAALLVPSLRTFLNIPVRPTREFIHAARGPATIGMNQAKR